MKILARPSLLAATSVFALIGFGCTPAPAEKKEGETPSKPTAAIDKPAKAVTLADLPGELKHEGFEYYGLGYEKSTPLQLVSPNGAIQTGEQKVVLKSFEDGKAIFEVQRTGGLAANMGNNELRVEADGVYVHSSSIAKVGERDLEVPAKMSPGSTWITKTEIANDSQKLKLTMNFKAQGFEDVTTPAGKFNALLVTGDGSGTINGKKARMETRAWYVKGRGNVKTEITTIDDQGARQSLRIEEAKSTG